MKADRDAADDAQAPRELPLVDPAPRGAPQRGPQRQRRLEGRESHEAPARGQGGVADRLLGHLYLALLPGGPILVPPDPRVRAVYSVRLLRGTPLKQKFKFREPSIPESGKDLGVFATDAREPPQGEVPRTRLL